MTRILSAPSRGRTSASDASKKETSAPFGTHASSGRGEHASEASRGPPPGYYDVSCLDMTARHRTHCPNACFKSKTDRLYTPKSSIPGPGNYESQLDHKSRSAPQAWTLGPRRNAFPTAPDTHVDVTPPKLAITCNARDLNNIAGIAPKARNQTIAINKTRKAQSTDGRAEKRQVHEAKDAFMAVDQKYLYIGTEFPLGRQPIILPHADMPMSAFNSTSSKGWPNTEGVSNVGPGSYKDICYSLGSKGCGTPLGSKGSATPENLVPFGIATERFNDHTVTSPELGPGVYNCASESPGTTPSRGVSPAFGSLEDRWTHVYRDGDDARTPGPCNYHRRRPSSVAAGCLPWSNPGGVGFGSGAKRREVFGPTRESRKPPLREHRLQDKLRETLEAYDKDARPHSATGPGPGTYGDGGVPEYDPKTTRNQQRFGFLTTEERFVGECTTPGPGDYNPRDYRDSGGQKAQPCKRDANADFGTQRGKRNIGMPDCARGRKTIPSLTRATSARDFRVQSFGSMPRRLARVTQERTKTTHQRKSSAFVTVSSCTDINTFLQYHEFVSLALLSQTHSSSLSAALVTMISSHLRIGRDSGSFTSQLPFFLAFAFSRPASNVHIWHPWYQDGQLNVRRTAHDFK